MEKALVRKLTQHFLDRGTLLLQETCPETVASFIRAAWVSGWKVALVRNDLPQRQLSELKKKLGNVIFCKSINERSVIIEDSNRIFLEEWVDHSVQQNRLVYHHWQNDECALILFTSGSTGTPKGVCHSACNLVRSCQLFFEHFGILEDELLYCLAPIHTMSGLRSILLPFVLPLQMKISHLTDFLQIICEIGEVKPDHIICGPVFLQQLAAYGARLSNYLESVKTIFCTGAAFVEQNRESIESSFGINILNYYGLTETGGIVLAESLTTRKPHCLPLPCQGVKLEMKQISTESNVHHLVIKSPNLFLGYLGSPLQRRSIFDTGDLVKKTEEGDLFLCGRSDGAVKSSSTEWIYPILLENLLKARFPTVDFHVLSLEISGGFALKVCLESSSPFSETSINKEIEKQLGTEYIPHSWEHVIIHRNPLGKILDIQKKNE